MDTTERRRLVYEILVEMQNIEKNTRQAENELKRLNQAAGVLKTGLKGAFAMFGIGFTLNAIVGAVKAFTNLDEQVGKVKDTFLDAAVRSSDFLNSLSEEGVSVEWLSFWEKMGEGLGDFIDALAAGIARLTDFIPGFALIKAGWHALKDDVENGPIALTITVDKDSMTAAFQTVSEEWQKASENIKIDPLPDPEKLRQAEQQVKDAIERGRKLLLQDETAQVISKARQSAIDPLAPGKRKEEMEAYQKALDQSVTSWAEMGTTVTDITEQQMPQLAQVTEDLSASLKATASILAHAFIGIFTGATHNAREFFNSILEGMAEIAAQAATQDLLKGILDAFTVDPVQEFHPTVRRLSAKGDVYDRSGWVPFQHGGVVNGPTVFPFAGGVGLMGEAGAEAIMPLKRGRGGALGVAAAMPSVQVINNTGVNADAKVTRSAERMQIVLEAANMGRSMALEEVNRSLRSGYGATAQSMQHTYGLRRRG